MCSEAGPWAWTRAEKRVWRADHRLIDGSQTTREGSEIFIRKPEYATDRYGASTRRRSDHPSLQLIPRTPHSVRHTVYHCRASHIVRR